MRISASNVVLASDYQLRRSASRKESLQCWVGQRPPSATGDTGRTSTTPHSPAVDVQAHAPAVSASCVKDVRAADDKKSDDQLDATSRIWKLLVEKMFGGKLRLASLPKLDPADPLPQLPAAPTHNSTPQQATRQGWGMEYKVDEVSLETEQLQFSAAGVIKTADGQEINFRLALQMQRADVEEQHIDIKAGDAALAVDPLVLNFDGSAAQLRSGTFQFDLKADGQSENLPLLGSTSAFLALDKNHDGQVNDGSELFGPTTGSGFSQLAQYDSDQNGWIDENDPVYSDLRLWQPSSDGKGQLATLAEKNVGAICLQSTSTPFTYKDSAGQIQGTLSNTGVFLEENGAPGTVQQLNYLA
jgi:hypothetical protein